MKFEDLQKIWDTQSHQSLYIINEEAMTNLVRKKKQKTSRFANLSEVLHISVNILAGSAILIADLVKQNGNVYAYALAGYMFLIAIIVAASRFKRIRSQNRFDLSIAGDLEHSLANAAYQVRFNELMRWYIVPLGALTLLALGANGKSLWVLASLLTLFIIIFLASSIEPRIAKRRKKELEILKQKIMA